MKKYTIFMGLAVALATVTGCLKNSDVSFPDFDHQSVYFANQYPVRTVILGEDLTIDNSLDNEHKIDIKATLGGTRDNKKNVVINFDVDGPAVSNLKFATGGNIQLMPPSYYTLATNQITIAKGSILGGVQVQLTDAFFADPLAIKNTYVLPLKMISVQNADSILAGKDFVFYAIKYINAWHGNYLRRGVDAMASGADSWQVKRHAAYVESDEVNSLKTKSLTQTEFPVTLKSKSGVNFSCTLLLTFDSEGKCTITTNTPNFTATGTGAFVKKGEKKSWGNKDRDALYLDYQISYTGLTVGSGTAATKDTLVMRDRAVTYEMFTPVAQ